jgi:hypothetical protein
LENDSDTWPESACCAQTFDPTHRTEHTEEMAEPPLAAASHDINEPEEGESPTLLKVVR